MDRLHMPISQVLAAHNLVSSCNIELNCCIIIIMVVRDYLQYGDCCRATTEKHWNTYLPEGTVHAIFEGSQ